MSNYPPLSVAVEIADNDLCIPLKLWHLRGKILRNDFKITLVHKPTAVHLSAMPVNGSSVRVFLLGAGYSSKAVAIRVGSVVMADDDHAEVEHFQKEGIPLHIPIALTAGTQPNVTYLSILEGEYDEFVQPVKVNGNIKYCY